ncbi:hypothetical protein [Bradyrhizobium sp. SRS-191]|uniref:hypothetical protein n=1 Tax=Bradyrhizobium sp. SRS-191 TaxID=2962606 RepID=UPI00211EFCC2|nr:hypothetical protein [Bradyrhizobium sp. SRS-191]
MTGFGAGAGAAGFSAFTGSGAAAFSAAGGLASSSAMIRRIDARISSMEGSWTFAGCVISDSKSATPPHAPAQRNRPGRRIQAAWTSQRTCRLVSRRGQIDAKQQNDTVHVGVYSWKNIRRSPNRSAAILRLCHGNK